MEVGIAFCVQTVCVVLACVRNSMMFITRQITEQTDCIASAAVCSSRWCDWLDM